MAIVNLIPKTTSAPTSWVELDVSLDDPKTLILTGYGLAEVEVAVIGTDAAYYTLATMDRQDVLEAGVLTVPGTYQLRITKIRHGEAGLDMMNGSA